MASYTVTTSADQEALLTWITHNYNIAHDTTLTNAQFAAARFPELLTPFAVPYSEAILAAVQAAFSEATAEVKASVLALLEVS